MAKFSIEEIIAATKGKCLCGSSHICVKDIVIDSRQVRKGHAFVAIRGVRHNGHAYVREAAGRGAVVVIVSETLKRYPKGLTVIKVKDTTRALGQLASFHRQRFDIPVIAVTGSAGKTTVKDMTACVLKAKYRVLKTSGTLNNQWGLPLTLLRLSSRYDCAVVEAGISQPGEMAALADIVRPTVAVFTNIGLSHLQGLKTQQKVFSEKAYLAKALLQKGVLVYCFDDPFLRKFARFKKKSLTFGLDRHADIKADRIVLGSRGISFRINKRHCINLRSYNRGDVLNVLAACACAKALGVRFSDAAIQLKKFRSSPGRQSIMTLGRIRIIDDTYNANPVSFANAVSGLADCPVSGKRHVVCGDMLELGGQSLACHRRLGQQIADNNIDYLWTFGKMGKGVCRQALSRGMASTHFDHIKDLNKTLLKSLKPGDCVLIKGSRSMHMERVVEFLKSHLG